MFLKMKLIDTFFSFCTLGLTVMAPVPGHRSVDARSAKTVILKYFSEGRLLVSVIVICDINKCQILIFEI